MPAPAISVVLCTRNGAASIADQLAALASQIDVPIWELVVVDNGSTDGTAAIVTRWSDRLPLRLVPAPAARGLAAARNVGVAASTAPLLAFCDDDDVVDSSWLATLTIELGEHPLIASRMEYDLLNDAAALRGRARFQSQSIETLFGAPVCNGAIGVTRSLWDAVGGNDESMRGTGEDFDFALRVSAHAGIVPRLSSAVYHYRQRATSRDSLRQAWRYGKSHVVLYTRHRDRMRRDRRAAADWWWLVTRLPVAWQPTRRVLWARRLGTRAGRLAASLRHHVWCP
jgi:glycosyltransferase involved in cell wall biosynthesis